MHEKRFDAAGTEACRAGARAHKPQPDGRSGLSEGPLGRRPGVHARAGEAHAEIFALREAGEAARSSTLYINLEVWNRQNGYPVRYYTQSSLDLANKPALLDAMAKAGFMHVFLGIETPDVALLKGAKKMQNIPGDQLEKFKVIREHGIHVVGGFIVGFDDERPVLNALRTLRFE